MTEFRFELACSDLQGASRTLAAAGIRHSTNAKRGNGEPDRLVFNIIANDEAVARAQLPELPPGCELKLLY